MLAFARRRIALALAVLAFALVLLAPRAASAQLHLDASVQGGVMKRFLFARAPNSDDGGFGPVAQVNVHVALLPLVRIGAYVGHDISPIAGDQSPVRDITWFGGRVKVTPPFPGSFKPYVFAGFGYAAVYQRSYNTVAHIPTGIGDSTTPANGFIQGAGGGYFEVPLGVGAQYNLFGPLALCFELTAHLGLGFSGTAYGDNDGPTLSTPGRPNDNAEAIGNDSFGLGLTAGLMLDL